MICLGRYVAVLLFVAFLLFSCATDACNLLACGGGLFDIEIGMYCQCMAHHLSVPFSVVFFVQRANVSFGLVVPLLLCCRHD